MSDVTNHSPIAGEILAPHQKIPETRELSVIEKNLENLAGILEVVVTTDSETAGLVHDTGEAFKNGQASSIEAIAADIVGLDRLHTDPAESLDTRDALEVQPAEILVEAARVIEQRSECAVELSENWKADDNGQLKQTITGEIRHANTGSHVASRSGIEEDIALAHVMANEVNAIRDDAHHQSAPLQAEVDRLDQITEVRGPLPQLEVAKAHLLSKIEDSSDPKKIQKNSRIAQAVSSELGEREKNELEQMINDRIESDTLPWTMPDSQLPQEWMDGIKKAYEAVIDQNIEPLADDEFRVAPPMKAFAESQFGYAPEDETLMAQAGLMLSERGMMFTRAELQQAGVFFVNRVGGGEQPIFGLAIPDQESPDGMFNVQDRSFLTRDEFEKVYKYQQEHGYGIDNRDPKDVQTDMMMFALRPESRKPGVRKGGGFGSRENKYGLVRSPFVENGFRVTSGVTADVWRPDGSFLRMNTTTVHLIDGHPDFPGVSEMYDTQGVAWDQKYMSAGDYVRDLYVPPPSKEEAFASIKMRMATNREQVWVGNLETN